MLNLRTMALNRNEKFFNVSVSVLREKESSAFHVHDEMESTLFEQKKVLYSAETTVHEM